MASRATRVLAWALALAVPAAPALAAEPQTLRVVAALRPQDRRSDLDHGADHREPRLHDLRHAVRARRKARGRSRRWSIATRSRADKLTWTFTLRDGLAWHDGAPVTAEDCIASLKRWGARDTMGQKLMSFVAELAAPDAKTIRMTLKEPYGLVLQTLAKPGANVPFMMPKRVADTDPQQADHRLHRLRARSSSRTTNGGRREGRLPEKPEIQAARASRPRASPAARSSRSIASSGSGSPTRRPRSTR